MDLQSAVSFSVILHGSANAVLTWAHVRGACMFFSCYMQVAVDNCTFEGNEADAGAAVEASGFAKMVIR